MATTDTNWDIKVYVKDNILCLEVDYEGEVPKTQAWIDLLDMLGDWSEKHCEKPMRVFKFPSITSPS